MHEMRGHLKLKFLCCW